MIADAAKLPPGPDAWQPILDAYPELTAEELVERFREAAWRDAMEALIREYHEAEELYFRARASDLRDMRDRVLRHPRVLPRP
jgi:phosphoenolpyruvate-protein kinase (PTS system EI component)